MIFSDSPSQKALERMMTYAELLGVSHQRINKRKQIILEKLRKKLTDRGC